MSYGRLNRLQLGLNRLAIKEAERTGLTVRFTPRSRCSCHDESGQARLGCRVCDGFGWFWRAEQEGYKRASAVQNAQLDREFTQFGIVVRGDLVITFPRRFAANPYDRVRFDVDQLRTLDIPAEAETPLRAEDGSTDRLAQRIWVAQEVSQSDPVSGAVTVYAPGVDYTVAGNAITWVGASQPAAGTRYAISYLADYDWIVTQPPIPRQVGTTGLANKLLLTRRVRDQRDAQELAASPYQGGIF